MEAASWSRCQLARSAVTSFNLTKRDGDKPGIHSVGVRSHRLESAATIWQFLEMFRQLDCFWIILGHELSLDQAPCSV